MSNPLYTAVFRVSSVLEIPVVIAALVALAFVVVELGRFAVELKVRRRPRRGPTRAGQLEQAARATRAAAGPSSGGSSTGGATTLGAVTWSARMGTAYAAVVAHLGDENAVAKDLADFDLDCQRRLARTRLLVRVGPALGLMGTLIPLAPALEGLARGDTKTLTDSLQLAFSITVLGLLVGAVAFGLSLARENMYGQDYSDLEYVAAILTDDTVTTTDEPPAPTPPTSPAAAAAPAAAASAAADTATEVPA